MKKILILTMVLFVLITVIVILGNIITIGEKMTAVIGVPYLEYVFYLVLLGLFGYLFYLVFWNPMMSIHKAPEFPVLSVEEKEKGVSEEEYLKRLTAFAAKLSDNCYYLPVDKREAHRAELTEGLAKADEQKSLEEIKALITQELKQRYGKIDSHIMGYSSKVFIITAVSSSNRIDTLATLGLNYRMVADIVRSSGFRPGKLQLIKIYYYVISAAFFSYFFQGASEYVDDLVDGLSDAAADLDVGEMEIPDVDASNIDFTQYVKNLNLPGIPLAPLADGLANAIMTIAIGYITKYYLQKGPKALKGANGRRVKLKAKMKALGQVPRLLAEVPAQIGSTGLSWAMKGFEKAYQKMSKDKVQGEEDFLSDMDRYEAEHIVPEEPKKKKSFFDFWRF